MVRANGFVYTRRAYVGFETRKRKRLPTLREPRLSRIDDWLTVIHIIIAREWDSAPDHGTVLEVFENFLSGLTETDQQSENTSYTTVYLAMHELRSVL